jgi:hypothetical protein
LAGYFKNLGGNRAILAAAGIVGLAFGFGGTIPNSGYHFWSFLLFLKTNTA